MKYFLKSFDGPILFGSRSFSSSNDVPAMKSENMVAIKIEMAQFYYRYFEEARECGTISALSTFFPRFLWWKGKFVLFLCLQQARQMSCTTAQYVFSCYFTFVTFDSSKCWGWGETRSMTSWVSWNEGKSSLCAVVKLIYSAVKACGEHSHIVCEGMGVSPLCDL